MVVVHGTTSEVLYWEYANEETGQSYINATPAEGEWSYDEAVAAAEARCSQALKDGTPCNREQATMQAAFGMASNWLADELT